MQASKIVEGVEEGKQLFHEGSGSLDGKRVGPAGFPVGSRVG